MQDILGNVLVVDDEKLIRKVLSVVLYQACYEVRTAEDGFSALVEIREREPDVLLSDLNMPGMSGFELLSVVRRRYPAIRVVAMSSAFPSGAIPPGIAADAFYEKGAGLGTLVQIVAATAQADSPRSSRNADPPVPIWIPTNGHDPAGEPYVIVSCPECLRTFPQKLDKDSHIVRETGCTHCGSAIHYAIVDSVLPPPKRPHEGAAAGRSRPGFAA